jgi:hypothetical protein
LMKQPNPLFPEQAIVLSQINGRCHDETANQQEQKWERNEKDPPTRLW